MTGDDDATLLARVGHAPRAEARAALAALYERHAGAVLGFVRRLCPDPADAEDVLQDTFLAAARRAGAFRGADARPWLLAIAGGRLRDLRRARARTRERERAAGPPGAGEPAAGTGGAPELERALARLAPRWRAAVELRCVQGLAHADVARVLGVSLRTAKDWSARGLARLRELLETESER